MAAMILVVGGATRRAEFVVLAAGFIPLALQDIYRYSAFRRGAASRASVMDTVWVIVCAGCWAQLTNGTTTSAAGLWVLGGIAGLIVGLLMERRQVAGWRASYGWWYDEARPLGGSLVVSRLSVLGGRQLAFIMIAGMLGEAALGNLRAAQLLFAPILLGLFALNYLLVPTLARRADRLSGIHAAGISGLVLAGAMVVAASVWLLQDWIYGVMFANAVRPSRAILAAVLTKFLLDATNTGYSATLKAQRRGRPLALADSVGTCLMLPAVLVAAYHFGIDAAAWGLVLQSATALLIFVLSYLSFANRDRLLT
jgi:O-antigen/teichoic acid export membrane protein